MIDMTLKIKKTYSPTRAFFEYLDDECKFKICNGVDGIDCNHCELIKISKERVGYDYLRLPVIK